MSDPKISLQLLPPPAIRNNPYRNDAVVVPFPEPRILLGPPLPQQQPGQLSSSWPPPPLTLTSSSSSSSSNVRHHSSGNNNRIINYENHHHHHHDNSRSGLLYDGAEPPSSSSWSSSTLLRWNGPELVEGLVGYGRHLAAGAPVLACQVLVDASFTAAGRAVVLDRAATDRPDDDDEWDNSPVVEKITAPFLLLAAAEELVASFGHLLLLKVAEPPQQPATTTKKEPATVTRSSLLLSEDFRLSEEEDDELRPEEASSMATRLVGLYVRVQMDLRQVKEVLAAASLLWCPLSSNTGDDHIPPRPESEEEENSKLRDANDDDDDVPPMMTTADARVVLEGSLDGLAEMARVRCKLIDLHCQLFRRPRPPTATTTTTTLATTTTTTTLTGGRMEAAALAVAQLQQSMETAMERIRKKSGTARNDDETAATLPALPIDPMVAAIRQELALWQCIFETCAALERCSFAGTLIKLRQWQELLKMEQAEEQNDHKGHPHSCTRRRWVVQAHRYILSLLPLYFDRIYTFASPLYGFDTTKLWTRADGTAKRWPTTSWNEVVIQLLRQQEKAGHTAAVCLALETSSNVRPERGYHVLVGAQSGQNDEVSNGSNTCWQAMYLRSTLRLVAQQTGFADPSPHASGPLLSAGQPSALGSWGGSHLISLASAINSPAPTTSRKSKSPVNQSPSFLNRKTGTTEVESSNSSVLEYAPDSGVATTWPHSIWERVSGLLSDEKLRNTLTAAETLLGSNGASLPAVRIYHIHEETLVESEIVAKARPATAKTSLFGFRWADEQVKKKQTLHKSSVMTGKLPTKIYVTGISDRLRLIYIVQGSQNGSDGHYHQANSDDRNVREFLEELAIQLSPQAIFRSSFLANEMTDKHKRLPSPLFFPDVDLSLEGEDSDLVQDYLEHVKEAFGLRPDSPLLGESSSRSRGPNTGRYTPNSPRRQTRRLQQQVNSKMDVSAVALFLGPELGRYL